MLLWTKKSKGNNSVCKERVGFCVCAMIKETTISTRRQQGETKTCTLDISSRGIAMIDTYICALPIN